MDRSIDAPDHRDGIKGLARAGYIARGVVYLIVGGLAVLAVFGPGGETTDSRGALRNVLEAPLGNVLLGALAIGLLGYALWRSIQAIKDTDHHGSDLKGVAIRSGLMVSAITHTLLAVFAARLIFTLGGDSGGGSQGLVGWLMNQPYGRWLVGAVGVAIIGAGVAHEIKAWKTKFDRHFMMPAHTQHWAYPLCRFGLAIRGAVFAIVGALFIAAAYHFDPSEAGGTSEAFDALREQAYGTVLLAIVAIGLVAFGIYSFLEAAYRRINLEAR